MSFPYFTPQEFVFTPRPAATLQRYWSEIKDTADVSKVSDGRRRLGHPVNDWEL